MLIYFSGDFPLAHIAHYTVTFWTPHFVATVLLDDLEPASWTRPDQSRGHGLLNHVTVGTRTLPPEFVACFRDVALALAQAATDHLTIRVLAREFSIQLDGGADGFEVAKGTLFETIKTRLCDLLQLLQGVEFGPQALIQDLLQMDSAETGFAVARVHAQDTMLPR